MSLFHTINAFLSSDICIHDIFGANPSRIMIFVAYLWQVISLEEIKEATSKF